MRLICSPVLYRVRTGWRRDEWAHSPLFICGKFFAVNGCGFCVQSWIEGLPAGAKAHILLSVSRHDPPRRIVPCYRAREFEGGLQRRFWTLGALHGLEADGSEVG
jgi:hypothetical protein